MKTENLKEEASAQYSLGIDPNINIITIYINNQTTAPITLNNLSPIPSESGNPPIIWNGDSSAGTAGNGYFIPWGQTAAAIVALGGSYIDPNSGVTDYPATQGSAVYNLSDGTITISWNLYAGVDLSTAVLPVVSDNSQWEGVVANTGSTYTVTVQAKS